MIHKNKKIKTIVLFIILVAAAGAAAFVFLNRQPANTPQTEPTQSEQTNTTPAEPNTDDATNEETTPIKQYELVTENEQYKIRREPNSNNYVITLYAIINRPEQSDVYRDQLREYKQNALQYLKDHGTDPNSVNITYEPEEAKDL